ncbi:hypothetical protein K438DRAFT_1837510 [Mycena galopus ATCC 62051]|nr:hypothetical protein K438DRAFT_1837510 [Mycena galopus ATCC 62051]
MNINMGMRNSSTSEAADRHKIIAWYSPLNFFLRQEDIFSTHQEGTGKWFLESEKFMQWKSERGQVLWCQGIPGAGKTVIWYAALDQRRE